MEMKESRKDDLLRYSKQLMWLKQLLSQKLLTKTEYEDALRKLQKDYGIVSNLTAT